MVPKVKESGRRYAQLHANSSPVHATFSKLLRGLAPRRQGAMALGS
jgi:hypothetical protein